jgi:hypothetical protein
MVAICEHFVMKEEYFYSGRGGLFHLLSWLRVSMRANGLAYVQDGICDAVRISAEHAGYVVLRLGRRKSYGSRAVIIYQRPIAAKGGIRIQDNAKKAWSWEGADFYLQSFGHGKLVDSFGGGAVGWDARKYDGFSDYVRGIGLVVPSVSHDAYLVMTRLGYEMRRKLFFLRPLKHAVAGIGDARSEGMRFEDFHCSVPRISRRGVPW